MQSRAGNPGKAELDARSSTAGMADEAKNDSGQAGMTTMQQRHRPPFFMPGNAKFRGNDAK